MSTCVETFAVHEDGDTVAWGAEFPSGTVVVEWNSEAFPPEDRLDFPHQSVYGCREDFEQVTNGTIV